MPTFDLKWSEDDPSRSIILCFDQKWCQPILNAEFSVVFRKAWPRKRDPKTMFAYVGSPLCKIVARVSINGWSTESLDSALISASAGGLSEKELSDYVGDKDKVFVIHLGRIEVAATPIPLSVLAEDYGYCPSPAAAGLSGRGEAVLSDLGQFSRLKAK